MARKSKLGAVAQEDAARPRLRAHGDGARRIPQEGPVADATLFVRLPKADLVWLKVYAAQQGKTMTEIAQELIHDLRARVEAPVGSGRR